MTVPGYAPHPLALAVYPGAAYGFDREALDAMYLGHRLVSDPAATADAIERVRMFLATHLRLRRRPNYGDNLFISAGRSDTIKV